MVYCILEPPSKKLIYFLGYIIFAYIREILEGFLNGSFNNKGAKFFEFAISYTIGDLICGLFVLIIKKRTDSAKIDEMPKFQNSLKNCKSITDLNKKNSLIFTDEESEIKSMSIKRVLYLSIYDLLAQSCIVIYFFINENEEKVPHNNMNLTFIVDITTRFILHKVRIGKEFYSHYYLSISLTILSFLILATSNIYYMIYDNFTTNQWIYLIQGIISTIFYSFENAEGKIGLNIEFLNPYSLIFYKGIIQSIFLIIISIILIILKQTYLFTSIFYGSTNIFISFIILFVYLMFNLFTNICIWKIIDFYSIQHLTIAKGGALFVFYIESLINDQLDYQKGEKIYIFYFTDILGFILLFIGTLIHNEIIIINCWGLSNYTHKKLLEREKTDLQLITDNSLNNSYDIQNKNTKDSKRSIRTQNNETYLNSMSELSVNLVGED